MVLLRIFQVDAFTDEAFKGNPAGVCILDQIKSDSWMQSLANEMNLSETAFLSRNNDVFDLRWFTPKTEVTLCGHATLASAHILWEERLIASDREAIFHTKSGLLKATKGIDLWIELDFPARFIKKAENQEVLNMAFNITPNYIGRFSTPNGDLYLIEVSDEEVVKSISPNFELLSNSDAKAIIITSISNSNDYDFVSRFFAPGVGINEDPVTGSAHCSLAPYWSKKLGKRELIGFQASSRTGIIRCIWNNERVDLKGKAVTVFKGELLI